MQQKQLHLIKSVIFINLNAFRDIIFQNRDSRKANNVGEDWVEMGLL